MKTLALAASGQAAPIVQATAEPSGATEAAAAEALRAAAFAFAQPLLSGRRLPTGEDAWEHATGTAGVLQALGAAMPLQAAAVLVGTAEALQRPQETLAQSFGEPYAQLVELTRRIEQVQRAATQAATQAAPSAGQARPLDAKQQAERVRRMLLSFSRDLRVVLLLLASRLHTLRWFASSRQPCPSAVALEARDVFAPLASRLGIWQFKWELEDLSFRFLQPEDYRRVARLLDETRAERELRVEFARHQLAGVLRQAGVQADVQGRPKHLYSIWRKMQGKSLAIERVFDISALRVVIDDVPACYAALAAVHQRYRVVEGEFDDYIARPKANGYQSLHTVVLGDDGRPVEVQIRTAAMHELAEYGVAAHWAYKEAGARGYAGVSAAADEAARVAAARQAVMQQLLAWERDVSQQAAVEGETSEERLFVLTPQATVVELSAGATPVDFAYALHTELGHRCRGARVDGAMVPLNTPLRSGQTVEVISAREGGPSRDWLNAELGYLSSPRARAKVRGWFNAQALADTVARGRELVEKLLQREGRTAVKLDDLAAQLGFKQAEALFEVVGKDEMSLRQIETLLRPAAPAPSDDEPVLIKRSRAGDSGVLVVGVESLMTSLSRCCRPAPPDEIGGFVTRGKGVAVHRRDCSNFRHMATQWGDRVIPVAWGTEPTRAPAAGGAVGALYPVDVEIEAADRQGLLRDISDVLARERLNVTGVNTRSQRSAAGPVAYMTFTVEVPDASRLGPVLRAVAQVSGVRHARRR